MFDTYWRFAAEGQEIYVDQVATVHIGDTFRVASLVKGTSEAVGGVVVTRSGAKTNAVIQGARNDSQRFNRACRLASGLCRSTIARRSSMRAVSTSSMRHPVSRIVETSVWMRQCGKVLGRHARIARSTGSSCVRTSRFSSRCGASFTTVGISPCSCN